jgi:hypothetical protein
MSEKPKHDESSAEQAIDHGEHLAVKFMAAAGLSLIAAQGLVVDAGALRDTYLKEFGNPTQVAYVQVDHQAGEPPPTGQPAGDGHSPLPSSGQTSTGGTTQSSAPASGWNTVTGLPMSERKGSGPGFFQSVWALHSMPSLSLGVKTDRTMLDDWLAKEADNFEKLERALRETPELVRSLDPKERAAFENIVSIYRAHQAKRVRTIMPSDTLPAPKE